MGWGLKEQKRVYLVHRVVYYFTIRWGGRVYFILEVAAHPRGKPGQELQHELEAETMDDAGSGSGSCLANCFLSLRQGPTV